jgi:Tol biopolymer transport system component
VSRWIGESVYLDVDRGAAGEALWRVDLPSSRIEDLTAAWPADAVKRRSTADVNAAGTEVVFAASPEGQTDLWTTRLDGSGLRRITNDAHVERSPIWIGSTRTVAFQSNRSGQLDMWTIDVGTERTEQITSSETAESPADATADGSKMLYEQVAESATLWLLPAGSLDPQQLSADALTDLWPSVDARGTRVAFQRRRPALSEGLNFIDSSVLVASLSGATLSNLVAVADGFAARISPDGSWVAHMQRGADRVDVLQARNLQTGETRIVSRTVPLPIRSGRFPIDWAAQRVTWAPAGALLYFVEESSGQQAIARVDLSAPASSAAVLVRTSEILEDVRLSPDGARLAYLRWRSGRLEFHVRDLATAADTTVWQEAGSQVAAFLRGWTAGGALVFLRNRAPSRVARGANRVEVVAAASGSARIVSTIEDAFTATGRLNGDGSRLFITRTEGGVHNIAAVSMADGTVRNVTGNKQPGVSFTGIEPLADGALIFVRAELRQDIWLAERQAR